LTLVENDTIFTNIYRAYQLKFMNSCKILILEDNEADADLIKICLHRFNITYEIVHAKGKKEFITALQQQQFDIILSDHALPQFSSFEALEEIKKQQLQIPFILVTGTVSEEFAVDILKRGADDYILKNNLTRLPTAITQAIEIHKIKNEKIKAEQDLKIAHQKILFHLENAPLGFIEWNNELQVKSWSKRAEEIFGWTEKEVIEDKKNGLSLVYTDDIPLIIQIGVQLASGEVERNSIQNRNFTKAGKVIWCQWFNSVLKDGNGKVVSILSLVQDITVQKNAEVEITKEKMLSDSIVNSLPGIFYLFDSNRVFLRWNKNFEKVTGYTATEIANINPTDFYEGEGKKIVYENFETVLKKGESAFEANLVTKTGKKIPYYFTGLLIQYEGKPCLIGTGIDITHRKKAEEEIQQSNDRFKLIALATNDVVSDWDLTNDNIWWNDRFYTLFNYEKNKGSSNINSWYNGIHPNDKKRVISSINTAIKAGQTYWYDEYRFLKADGTTVDIFDRGYLILDENNKACRMVGAMQDITERKKAEEQILKTNERFNLIALATNDMVWDWNLITNEVWWNEQYHALFNHQRKNKINKIYHWYDGIHPEDKERVIKAIHQSIDTRQTYWSDEYRFLKGDGTTVFVFDRGYIICDENNKPYRMVGAILDITQRKKAEVEIKQVNKELRELSGHLQSVREEERLQIAQNIHDELGQQLTGLKIDIEWMNTKISEKDVLLKQKAKELIPLIRGTIQTVRRISSNLRPSMLDDLGLVAALEWQSQETEKRFDIKVNFISNIPDTNLSIEITTALFRIYQEALTNAIRHANAHEIKSFLQIQENSIILEVEDNGKGIDTEKKRKNKSFGLLGIKERTFALGGTFELKSHIGKGTLIKIVIPL
jgi:PAS domain S-box-containing protein